MNVAELEKAAVGSVNFLVVRKRKVLNQQKQLKCQEWLGELKYNHIFMLCLDNLDVYACLCNCIAFIKKN